VTVTRRTVTVKFFRGKLQVENSESARVSSKSESSLSAGGISSSES
jgi:hypothetical protein